MNTKKAQSTQRKNKYHPIYFLVSPSIVSFVARLPAADKSLTQEIIWKIYNLITLYTLPEFLQ